MRIQNYEIEPYEYGYMVSEVLVAKKGDNIGTEYKTDTKYPRDLTRALQMVRDNLQRKKIQNTLQDSIDTLISLDKQFLQELQSILSTSN